MIKVLLNTNTKSTKLASKWFIKSVLKVQISIFN